MEYGQTANGTFTSTGCYPLPPMDLAAAWGDPRVGDALRRIEGTVAEMAGTDVQLSTNMRPRSEKGYILFQVTATFRFPIGRL